MAKTAAELLGENPDDSSVDLTFQTAAENLTNENEQQGAEALNRTEHRMSEIRDRASQQHLELLSTPTPKPRTMTPKKEEKEKWSPRMVQSEAALKMLRDDLALALSPNPRSQSKKKSTSPVSRQRPAPSPEAEASSRPASRASPGQKQQQQQQQRLLEGMERKDSNESNGSSLGDMPIEIRHLEGEKNRPIDRPLKVIYRAFSLYKVSGCGNPKMPYQSFYCFFFSNVLEHVLQ